MSYSRHVESVRDHAWEERTDPCSGACKYLSSQRLRERGRLISRLSRTDSDVVRRQDSVEGGGEGRRKEGAEQENSVPIRYLFLVSGHAPLDRFLSKRWSQGGTGEELGLHAMSIITSERFDGPIFWKEGSVRVVFHCVSVRYTSMLRMRVRVLIQCRSLWSFSSAVDFRE